MYTESIIRETVLSLSKGQFVTFGISVSETDMDSKMKIRANPYRGLVTKKSEYQSVRICDYEHLEKVRKMREEGKEAKKPWYVWDTFPYIAKHPKTQELYVVVKPTDNSKTISDYYVRGVKVETSVITPHLKKAQKDSLMFLIPFRQIVSIKQSDIQLG